MSGWYCDYLLLFSVWVEALQVHLTNSYFLIYIRNHLVSHKPLSFEPAAEGDLNYRSYSVPSIGKESSGSDRLDPQKQDTFTH